MCFFQCDFCEAGAVADRSGYTYLVPNGWYVVANGSAKTRTFERVVCSPECAWSVLGAPDAPDTLETRQVTRG